MAYVPPGGLSVLSAKLQGHPRFVMLFQQQMGVHLNAPGAELPPQIQDYPRIFDGKAKQLHKLLLLHLVCPAVVAVLTQDQAW